MLRSLVGVGLVVGLIGILLSSSPAEEKVRESVEVGFAERDITPEVKPGGKPVYLAGFGKNRKATGVHDPLMARTVVFREGKKKIAIVSVDLVGLFLDFTEGIRKQLPDFTHVVISSTHNHEGPDTMGIWGPSPLQSGLDKDYMAKVEKEILASIKAADAAKSPASGEIGSVKAPELLHDARIPIVLHDDLVVLHIKDRKKGKSAGLIVQWNCHPETLGSDNTLVSSDYVGYTVNQLKKQYGCPVVYLTGTVGGLMTSLHVPIKDEKGNSLKDGTYEKTARYGELLAVAADKAIKSAKPLRLTPLSARVKSIHLPLSNRLYVVARQLGVFQREAFLVSKNPGKLIPIKEIDDPKKDYAIRTEVAHVRLGDLDIACIPGEIYPELVLGKIVDPVEAGADFPDAPKEPAIYEQLRGPHKMLIGLANDEIGYILPLRQWDEKPPYCYGKKKGQYGEVNSLGPRTAPLLCEAFRDLLKGKE